MIKITNFWINLRIEILIFFQNNTEWKYDVWSTFYVKVWKESLNFLQFLKHSEKN